MTDKNPLLDLPEEYQGVVAMATAFMTMLVESEEISPERYANIIKTTKWMSDNLFTDTIDKHFREIIKIETDRKIKEAVELGIQEFQRNDQP